MFKRFFNWAIPVLVLLITMIALPVGADWTEPQPPDEFPVCQRGMEGKWHYTRIFNASFDLVQVSGKELYWGRFDQTTTLSLIDARENRRLYHLDPPLKDVQADGVLAPYFNYFLFETPLGKFGTLSSQKIWPCAATIIFCRDRFYADLILNNDFNVPEFSTYGCIDENFVPYPLTWE